MHIANHAPSHRLLQSAQLYEKQVALRISGVPPSPMVVSGNLGAGIAVDFETDRQLDDLRF